MESAHNNPGGSFFPVLEKRLVPYGTKLSSRADSVNGGKKWAGRLFVSCT